MTKEIRHAEAQRQRRALMRRLEAEGAEDLAHRLLCCGRTIKLRCTHCMNTKTAEERCERRWCPVCMRKIAAERVSRYALAMDRMQWPLFLTLTVQNSEEAWAGIKHLKASIGRFKRSRWWQACEVKGGVTAIEITNRGYGWHPHAHMLIDCAWLGSRQSRPRRGVKGARLDSALSVAKEGLHDEWAKHCRQPTASCQAKRMTGSKITEVLKYSADPGTLLNEQGRISELIRAIDKFRMIQPWGSCYGIGKLLKAMADAERPKHCCDNCGCDHVVPVLDITRPNRPQPSIAIAA